MIGNIPRRALAAFAGLEFKHYMELSYWKSRARREQTLSNSHYKHFYTTFFGLNDDYYRDKRILDIGCGPRGSLEWASMAAERVGLDPLVDRYLKLVRGTKHAMTYVKSHSENIPFADGYFNVVCSFNSLDHVDDPKRTVGEIKRVVRSGGMFLLIVEVNHEPTECEPISLGWDVLRNFTDSFTVVEEGKYEIGNHDIYGQLGKNDRFDEKKGLDRAGVLTAKLAKERS